jgi:hypothetical protein
VSAATLAAWNGLKQGVRRGMRLLVQPAATQTVLTNEEGERSVVASESRSAPVVPVAALEDDGGRLARDERTASGRGSTQIAAKTAPSARPGAARTGPRSRVAAAPAGRNAGTVVPVAARVPAAAKPTGRANATARAGARPEQRVAADGGRRGA